MYPFVSMLLHFFCFVCPVQMWSYFVRAHSFLSQFFCSIVILSFFSPLFCVCWFTLYVNEEHLNKHDYSLSFNSIAIDNKYHKFT